MKLLVCTSEYYPYGAGIANVAYYVVSQLRKMGVHCTVCSPTGPDIKLGSHSMIARFGYLGLLYYWYQVAQYFKKRADDYDVAWLHYPLFLRQNPFRKCLVTTHGTAYGQIVKRIYPLHLHLYYNILSKIETYCLNKIGGGAPFTGVSSQICKELEEIGIDKKRITYIPNGVDTIKFKPAEDKSELRRRRLNILEDNLVILSLGSLIEHKQPYKLIKVFALIDRSIKGVTLVVAGAGGLLEGAKRLAQQSGLANVIFLGHADHEKEAPHLYACSDFFMMTSNYEAGEPTLTVAEAMASGLPCIVSDIPNRRVIEDANCGLAVNFSDEEKAAQEIIDYLRDDHSEHSRNAREYAVSNLDWKFIAERYLEGFEKVLSNERQ